MHGADKESTPESPSEVSPVDAKLRRIEELAEQIAHEDERLAGFWQELTRRLSLVEVEGWSDDLLECSTELLFDAACEEGEEQQTSSGERGLQLGFAPAPGGEEWNFRVRPASVVHGSTLYASLEKPEPGGESRPLELEGQVVRLAALRQLPELLDCILGSLNDSLAIVRTALGDALEADALVSSPFSHRGGTTQAAVINIGGNKATEEEPP